MISKCWIPFVAILALLAAPAETRPPGKPAGAKAPLTDAEIEWAIRERFARSKCAADRFTVRVQGGVATIDGRTDVVQRKGAATRMARAAGARKVVNRIQISDAAKAKASEKLATGRRRAQVTRGDAR